MTILGRVGRGLVQMLVLMLGCTLLVFILQSLSGRDPGRSILGIYASQEAVDALNEQLGANQPALVQYIRFLGDILRGDFGISYYSASPVADLIGPRVLATGMLLLMGFVFAFAISLPLSMVAARRPGGIADGFVRSFTIAGTVMPAFWLGILLILVIALPTGLFPVGGYGDTFAEHLRGLVLPALTLGIGLAPVQIRTLRTAWIRSMDSPYVEAARSRGVGQSRLMVTHALPNSVTPLISIVAVQIGWSIFSAVIVENTFRIPGLGQGLVLAANQSDFPVVNATTLVLAFTVVFVSFTTDWISMLFNPRLRSTR
ncbi:ABC transporter permease [Microbacterium protaetiae]|uniref:ABC transporter permease n=1 Tax=Microbacterium protaetiae TaxID=2509458 RepID=A0A4P6ECH0_9MICO|nr:ABC transporter permease [Microbacterium protaetiae]QAY59925.1 ABC transporter permease [Microbacterium protaetiae]